MLHTHTQGFTLRHPFVVIILGAGLRSGTISFNKVSIMDSIYLPHQLYN